MNFARRDYNVEGEDTAAVERCRSQRYFEFDDRPTDEKSKT
jgi:hypothetical protein